MRASRRRAPIAELSDEHWDEMWRTNVSGMFFAVKDTVPHLLSRGGGAIVITGSAFGHRGQPQLAAYNANKFGAHGLMRSVALELGPQNIHVNAVAPGADDRLRPQQSSAHPRGDRRRQCQSRHRPHGRDHGDG